MGYKNKSYQKSLHQQAYDRLTEKLHAGEGTSKAQAKLDGTMQDKIFSYATYQTYSKHCQYFTKWVKEHHPEVTNLKQAQPYAKDWLRERIEQGGKDGKQLSAWTINVERQAISKLYGIKPDDKAFFKEVPTRHRVDIIRSRGGAPNNFNEGTHRDLVNFCKATGLRRNVLERLTGKDYASRAQIEKAVEKLENLKLTPKQAQELKTVKDTLKAFPETQHFIINRGDKGGRSRFSPIIGEHKDEIADKMKALKPDEKLFGKVSKNAPIHTYRAEYGTAIYKAKARDIKDIPRVQGKDGKWRQKDAYICRGDEKGRVLDKEAMRAVSLALGHNREEVFATNYMRD